ncbi:hypothetical protein AYR66_03115 [Noviherbaspirillum denitrificans]|uniref:Recombinase domain-containing protein n=2 Tax=Noviherbaspirillum denitrificans TaxID=1968433 RepID=A0A254T661_9BURK|nr:hypothetical protein AYR66_03115 [Noviherbaspirillum denitrificans]
MFQQLLKDTESIARDRHSRLHDRALRMKPAAPAATRQVLCLLESIHASRAKGESFAAIAAELNKQGLTGPYGGRWYASSVWHYLQRRS